MYTLVVCEKPDAARRIASALDGNARESRVTGKIMSFSSTTTTSVFDVTFGGKNYKVCSALGHLYGITDRTKNRSIYPVFDLEWEQVENDSKKKGRSVKAARLISTIAAIAKDADSFVHACDYDQEGEVIGYSILEYACGGKYDRALRAKFSTLTDDEIRGAFTALSKPSAGLAQAGRSRHMLDFIYGVNLSRALAQSFKAGNKGYRNLSIGRVQGPTLAFVSDREFEIRLHVPDPYWVVTADFEKKRSKDGQIITIHTYYEKPRLEKLVEAQAVIEACTGNEGVVSKVSAKKTTLRPPTPFNTGDLQREAYRLFKVAPGYTLAIAEKLYLRALISYPRTSSQKLPSSINYRKILSGLAETSLYNQAVSTLLARDKPLVPNEGPMNDPAHPAIYPTGVAPRLSGLEFKIYDLIAKRFLATFGDPAITERTEVQISIKDEHRFIAEGRVMLYEGWTKLYRPYINLEQSMLPELQQGEILANRQVAMEEKFTQPPWRFTQASLLAKMEEEKIGTKATRADTIATLFKRNYIVSAATTTTTSTSRKKRNVDGSGGSTIISNTSRGGIQATDLGFAVVESAREHAPAIVSTELTRTMEEQLEEIEQGTKEPADVIGYAAEKLIESLATFRSQSAAIGKKIGVAITAAATANSTTTTTTTQSNGTIISIGNCPVCIKGQLHIIRSKKTKKRFVGCSSYSSLGCRASSPLPQKGGIRPLHKVCKCGWPIVAVTFFGNRGKRWNICVNIKCPHKEDRASLSKGIAQP